MQPSDIIELFNQYAAYDDGIRRGVPWGWVKQFLTELDMLDGIPADLVDAYVRENMLRADQDQDGLLSCQEFLLWVLAEVTALLPFKGNGNTVKQVAPLYNRFLFYAQRSRGNDGVSQKNTGMWASAFFALAKDMGWCQDLRVRSSGISVASSRATSDRTQGQKEGGTRLQYVQFISALQHVSSRKQESLDSILYKVVGDSTPPPLIRSRGGNRPFRLALLKDVIAGLIEGPEGPLQWTTEICTRCGKEHSRWTSWGASTAARMASSHRHTRSDTPRSGWRFINTRNLRGVFHGYNLKHNKADIRSEASRVSDRHSTQGAPNWAKWEKDPWGETGGWDACCCMYKQMSLMEMQTFLKLCTDNPYIWGALQAQHSREVGTVVGARRGSPAGALSDDWTERLYTTQPHSTRREMHPPLTMKRLETAFLTACSISSCYCSDKGCGIHDKPIQGDTTKLRAPRGQSGPKEYGTPFDANAVKTSVNQMRAGSARGRATVVNTLQTLSPKKATICPTSVATKGDVGPHQHRAATPTLSFPQFLEALRLVAEDIKGHPHDLAHVEDNLWHILHDVVNPGCPLDAWATLSTEAWAAGKTTVSVTSPREAGVYYQSPGEQGGARQI